LKIHDHVQAGIPDPTRAAPRTSPTKSGLPVAGAAGRAAAAPGPDHVELSHLAAQMQAAAIADEARHAERLDELRARIAAGRYEVAPEEVAQAILREEILPWIKR
jgi:flagellar biosynthesis anti-sigma factor FlgM